MQPISLLRKTFIALSIILCFLLYTTNSFAQKLQINDSGYFEKRGVNVLVFNYEYSGMFFDEKTSGIELIHHGVQTRRNNGT